MYLKNKNSISKMKLGGDSKSIYKKILGCVEKEVTSCKESVKKLKVHSNPEKIIEIQSWIKNNPFCSKKLEDVNVDVKIDPRLVYSKIVKLKYFGFQVKDSSVEGIMIGSQFIRFTDEDKLILERACEKNDKLLACSVVCPEKVVESFLQNYKSIANLSNYLKSAGVEAKNTDKIIKLIENSRDVFKKLEKVSMVEETINEALIELNLRIEKRISDLEIILRGKKILEVMKGDTSILRDVEELIAEEILRCEKELEDKLKIEVSGLFSHTYPVSLNEIRLKHICEELENEVHIEMYKVCKTISKEIIENYSGFLRELETAKNIELSSAIKKIGNVFPEIADYTAFIDGKHLFIKDPQPITYSVGDSPISKGRVVILTGANSGGKTSLLELIAQVQIMGQMGFPVKAKKAWINVFDGIYFFKKKRGVLGAGAFESAVKSFVKAVASEGKNLILIDEFEAITEPGAAVSIIAELLKVAYEKGHFVVIVSHLGKELKERLHFARVDGIEARGLDENFNLIVNRQPIFGKLGRSTPELIIERMYRKSKNELERTLLRKILENINY